MSVIKIDKNNFKTEIMESDKPVLIDFWATWCGPCMMMSPIIEEISKERADIKVAKINVDEESELAATFNISSIPAFFLIKDGKAVSKAVGAMPKEQLIKKLISE